MKFTEAVGVGVGVGVLVGEGVGVTARGTGAVFAGSTEPALASNKQIRTKAIVPMNKFLEPFRFHNYLPKKRIARMTNISCENRTLIRARSIN